MSLVYFTVRANFAPLVADLSTDADYNPNVAVITAKCTFTPRINTGDVLKVTTASPPTSYLTVPVDAIIDGDGLLKLRSTPDAGGSGTYAPVRLLGNSEDLNLDTPLYYDFKFSDLRIDGKLSTLSITGGSFEAPGTDTTVDLIEYFGEPGSTATGLVRPTISVGTVTTGNAGSSATVTNSGSPTAGVFNFTIPRGDTATVAVGSVSTGLPGSAATVTNSGTSGAAVLDFAIPQGVAGSATINGITATELSRLVCTTANGHIGAENGANTWAKLLTISTGTTQNTDVSVLLGVTTSFVGNAHDNAVVSLKMRSNTTGGNPTLYVEILSKAGVAQLIAADSFKFISGGWGTDAELWIRKPITYGCFAVYELARRVSHVGGVSLTYNNGAAWQSAVPVGAVNNVSTNGVMAFGDPVVTTTAAQTLTNKTLTSPRIAAIADTAGATAFGTLARTSAVNYVVAANAAAGADPELGATGGDTQVGLTIGMRGTTKSVNINDGQSNEMCQFFSGGASSVNHVKITSSVTGAAPRIEPAGTDTNISLNLIPKGTGAVQANGVDVVTTTGTQSLSNKTISGASNTVTNLPASATPEAARLVCATQNGDTTAAAGANTWAKIGTFSPGAAQNSDLSIIYAVTNSYLNAHENSLASVTFRTTTVGNNPLAYATFLAKSGTSTFLANDALKIVAGAFGTDFELWVKKSASYGGLAFYEISRKVSSVGSWAVTYNSNAAWQEATPTGAALNVTSDMQMVHTTSTQTLTNKTLTSPRINDIRDDSGNHLITFGSTASAVNRVGVFNAVTGVSPTISATGGDTNIDLSLSGKGTGGVRIPRINDTNGNRIIDTNPQASAVNYLRVQNGPTGGQVHLQAIGSDANVNLNLVPQGTGTVRANNVDVVTTTGTQSLSNKTLASPTLTTPTINGATITGTVNADMLLAGTRTTHHEVPGLLDGTRPVLASMSHIGTGPAFLLSTSHNDLTYLTRRGGTVTATKNGSAATLTTASAMFEPNLTTTELSGGVATNDVVVIEVDFSTMISPSYAVAFGNFVGIDSRVGQSAKNVTIEAWNTVTLSWEAVGSITNNPTGMFGKYTASADAKTKLRYTLTNFVTTTLRITQLFAVSSGGSGFEAPFVSRAGGNLYGTSATPAGFSAVGSDANVSLNLTTKGTGSTVQANGVPVVTTTGSQTLTNKTLTNPKISQIDDSNGAAMLATAPVSSAVNYVGVANAATGGAPYVYVTGADSNIPLYLYSRGTGQIRLNGSGVNGAAFVAQPVANGVNVLTAGAGAAGVSPYLSATGSDANLNLNLASKGTGTVQANGVDLVTTTGSQALSSKTWVSAAVPATATSTGTVGQIAYDSSFVYVCTATNTWRRAALATW